MSEARHIEVATDRLPVGTLQACMGVQACGRICEVTLNPLADEEALPYEYDCPNLATPEGTEIPVSAIYRKEFTQAVAMPTIDFLGAEGTASEARAFLTSLKEGHAKFEDYLTTILRGSKLPRTAAAQSEATWQEHTYVSPNANSFKDTEEEETTLRGLYAQLRGFHDLDSIKTRGILFDGSMQRILKEAAMELGVGHHIKLSGEPGVAKTSLAKYLGSLNARAHHPDWTDEQCEPVLISLSSTAEAEAQVSEQTFEENTLGNRLGVIAEAMREGRVVVLDEQNGMTADQQVYFNDMFLKAPGQTVRVGKEYVTIAPGFAVIATVNPMTDTQGNRRHGRQQQDSAGAARYTRIDVPYPGQKGFQGQPKETYSRLFYAHYADQYGWQQPTADVLALIDNAQEYMVKLTKKATEAPADGTSTSGLLASAQARPEIAECITPRDFSRMLESVMTHNDITSLPAELRKALAIKTEQILHSDNGHYVTPAAATAVKTLMASNGIK